MDRAEKVGLGVAAAGHLVLFGLLSVGFLATPNPERLKNPPVEVSLVPEVALESAAPEPAAEPAQSIAPEEGPPEDAAPPEPAPPEPAPPEPRPAPPQPAPEPRPAPPKLAPPKPAPAPKPAPKASPKPPQPRPAAQPKTAPKAPAQPKAVPKQAAAPKKAALAAAKKGTGASQTASAARPRGSRLGDDFLKGLSPEPSRSTNPNPPAARVGPQQLANIASAIQRQIQPCALRQVLPGPGAERIVPAIALRINRDGSLAARPIVRGHKGVDDSNSRYVERVDELAIAAFTACSPLRGLPSELYDVPGGWRSIVMNFRHPG